MMFELTHENDTHSQRSLIDPSFIVKDLNPTPA